MSSIYNLLDLLAQPITTPFFDSPLMISDADTDNTQGATGTVSRRHHGHRGGDRWQTLTATPRLDIHETDQAYKATLEIPGCKSE